MSIKTTTKRSERSRRRTNVWQKPRRKTLPTKKRRWPSLNRGLASWRNLFRREGKSPSHLLRVTNRAPKTTWSTKLIKAMEWLLLQLSVVWHDSNEAKGSGMLCSDLVSSFVSCLPCFLNENSPAVTAIFDNILYAVNSKLLLKVENCISVSVLLVNLASRKFWQKQYLLQ